GRRRGQAPRHAGGGGVGPGARSTPASDPRGRGGGARAAGSGGAGPENRHGDAGPRTLSASSSRRDLQGSGSALTREEAEAVLAQAGERPDEASPLLDYAIACATHDYPVRDADGVRILAVQAHQPRRGGAAPEG